MPGTFPSVDLLSHRSFKRVGINRLQGGIRATLTKSTRNKQGYSYGSG